MLCYSVRTVSNLSPPQGVPGVIQGGMGSKREQWIYRSLCGGERFQTACKKQQQGQLQIVHTNVTGLYSVWIQPNLQLSYYRQYQVKQFELSRIAFANLKRLLHKIRSSVEFNCHVQPNSFFTEGEKPTGQLYNLPFLPWKFKKVPLVLYFSSSTNFSGFPFIFYSSFNRPSNVARIWLVSICHSAK